MMISVPSNSRPTHPHPLAVYAPTMLPKINVPIPNIAGSHTTALRFAPSRPRFLLPDSPLPDTLTRKSTYHPTCSQHCRLTFESQHGDDCHMLSQTLIHATIHYLHPPWTPGHSQHIKIIPIQQPQQQPSPPLHPLIPHSPLHSQMIRPSNPLPTLRAPRLLHRHPTLPNSKLQYHTPVSNPPTHFLNKTRKCKLEMYSPNVHSDRYTNARCVSRSRPARSPWPP